MENIGLVRCSWVSCHKGQHVSTVGWAIDLLCNMHRYFNLSRFKNNSLELYWTVLGIVPGCLVEVLWGPLCEIEMWRFLFTHNDYKLQAGISLTQQTKFHTTDGKASMSMGNTTECFFVIKLRWQVFYLLYFLFVLSPIFLISYFRASGHHCSVGLERGLIYMFRTVWELDHSRIAWTV